MEKLKFRSFTFDSCQGEERDIIYFSFVATPEKDKLWTVLPKSLQKQDEEEIDRNKRMQRLNVAFSRGKEKLIFVHSKPVGELSAGKEVLQHYASVLAKAKTLPTEDMVDQNSPAEKKVLNWIKASPVFMSEHTTDNSKEDKPFLHRLA
ncbi:AAA domain-containing protein, partial [Paracoccaceae bacterium]|nr:AAA domain-containing protein [Paracoccaceae bacterium]